MSFLDRFKRPAPDDGTPKKPAAPTPAPASGAKPEPAAKADEPKIYTTNRIAAAVNAGYNPGLKSPPKKAKETPPAATPPAAPPAAPEGKHEILLELGDFLPRIPKQLLHDGPHDLTARLVFDIADLADRIARGQTTILLTEIHRRAPEIFREEILASNDTEVRFPWQKVMRMLADARTATPTAPLPGGLTPDAAESLAEKLRNRRAVRNIIPGMAEITGTPHPSRPRRPRPPRRRPRLCPSPSSPRPTWRSRCRTTTNFRATSCSARATPCAWHKRGAYRCVERCARVP